MAKAARLEAEAAVRAAAREAEVESKATAAGVASSGPGQPQQSGDGMDDDDEGVGGQLVDGEDKERGSSASAMANGAAEEVRREGDVMLARKAVSELKQLQSLRLRLEKALAREKGQREQVLPPFRLSFALMSLKYN